MNKNEVALQFNTLCGMYQLVSTVKTPPNLCISWVMQRILHTGPAEKPSPKTCNQPSLRSWQLLLEAWSRTDLGRISWNCGRKGFPTGSERYSMCLMSLPRALIIRVFRRETLLCMCTLHTVQQCLNKWETIQTGKDFCPVWTTIYPHIRNQPTEGESTPHQCCCVWSVESL